MIELLRKHWKAVLAIGGLVAAAVAVFVIWLWYTVASFDLGDMVFYLIAAVTVGCAAYAILSRNIVRAVFALLGTFFGMAGLYAMLSADFVAVIQLLVYVGGILVLMLFAVMFTSRIEKAQRSSRSAGLLGMAGAGLIGLVIFGLLGSLAVLAPWRNTGPGEFEPTIDAVGQELLGSALLPFELLSVVLLGIVIGALVVARMPSIPLGRTQQRKDGEANR